MIRLCIISTIPTTVKIFFGDQLRYLQENDFDITVISSSNPSNSQSFGKDLSEGVKVETVNMTRTIDPLSDIKALFEIIKIIKKGNFDIVQYVTPKAVLLGSVASWLCRTSALCIVPALVSAIQLLRLLRLEIQAKH